MSIIYTDSQYYTDIANAIRSKNGESGTYSPDEMANKILDLPTSDLSIADVFNHGDVVGLNPYYKFQVGSTSGLTITDEKITCSKSNAYANFCFTQLVDKRIYSKIFFDLEVPNTYDGYKDVVVGSRNYSLGAPPQNYEYGMPNPYIQLVGWYEQKNYSGTSPWYALPRCTVSMNISSAIDSLVLIEIYRHYGDLIIYSIWLE